MESLMEMLKAKGLVTTCDFDPGSMPNSGWMP